MDGFNVTTFPTLCSNPVLVADDDFFPDHGSHNPLIKHKLLILCGEVLRIQMD